MSEQISIENQPKPVPKKMGWFKKIALFFVIVFFLVFLAIATLPLYSSVLISYITQPASQITNRQISIGDLAVNILGSSISIENIEIKEENGVDNFFKVEKIAIDFEAFSMLAGKFNFPTVTVSGVYANVVLNEAGEANYNSIQKHIETTSSKEPKVKETKPSKPITNLPEVNAHIELSNINLLFHDRQQQKKFELKKFDWKLDIATLNDIRYRSSWEKLQIEDGLEKFLVSLVYLLEGSAKVALENGKFVVQAKGELGLTNIETKKDDQPLMQNTSITFKHDLACNMNLGTLDVHSIVLDSPYIKSNVHGIQIRRLNEFQTIMTQMATVQSRDEIQSLLGKLPLEDWQGNFSLQVNLDEIQKTFGHVVAQKSEEKLTNFGGSVTLSGKWKGQPSGIAIEEQLLMDKIFFIGKLPQEEKLKDYRLAFSVHQNFISLADLLQRKVSTDSQIKITTPIQQKNETLLEHIQKAQLINGKSLQNWGITQWTNSLILNLDTWNVFLQDFLPKGTKIAGLLSIQDEIKTIEKTMNLIGQTDFRIEIKTEKYPNLPGLQIAGNRNVSILLDEKQFPQKVQIQRFDLKSANNKLLHVEGKGEVDLQTFKNPTLQISIAMQFAELQPYLEPFLDGIQLAGSFENKVVAKESNQKIILTKQGKLNGFIFNLPILQGKSPIYPFKFNPLDWTTECVIGQHPKHGNNGLVVHPSFVQINQNKQKLFRCDYQASLYKQEHGVALENAKLTAYLYAKPLQNILPIETIQNPQLLELWTKNLTLDGVCLLECNAQVPSPNDVKMTIHANFNDFVAKFQDPEKGLILNKKEKVPLFLTISMDAEKKDSSQNLIIHDSMAQINQVKIPFGHIRIQDGKHITANDGVSPVQIFQIGPCKLAEFAEILPIIQQMQLDTASLESKLDQVLVHVPEEVVQGKFFLRFVAPKMNLERLQQTGKKIQERQPIRKRLQGEEPPLQKLSQKLRDTFKNIGIDVDIRIDKVILDRANQAEDLKLSLGFNHKDKIDNQMKLDITGKIGPGNILVKGFSDLDREHPEWKFDYDFKDVPYSVTLLSGITEKLDTYLQFPLLKNIQFKDQAELRFGLKGSNSWYGIDPRGIQRSMVSGDDIVLELPSGKFDLGLDMSKFLDVEAIRQDIAKKLQPLEQALQPLRSEEGGLLKQIETGESQIKPIRDRIADIRSKREPLLEGLKKLEFAAKYNPGIRDRLNKAKDDIGVFDKQLAEQEKQQTQVLSIIEKHRASLQELRKKIQAEENKLAQMREELQKKTQLANPFQFQFDQIQIKLKVSNEQMWSGQGTLEKLLSHPLSKVNYVELIFRPSERKFPKITGWCSFDGKYHFNFLPTEELPQGLGGRMDVLREKIKEKGISWGSDGFDSKLFD